MQCRLGVAARLIATLVLGVAMDQASARIIIREPVIEFYNQGTDHYFRTAVPDEARAIDNGVAGPGWRRTGSNFYSIIGGPSDPVGPVCRFYSVGENSHFYTLDAGECEHLKGLEAVQRQALRAGQPFLGWIYEGIAFEAVFPDNGTCSRYTAVRRFYNRGFQRGVSGNHRFTMDPFEWHQMKAAGWTDEGVAMCLPQIHSASEYGEAPTGGMTNWPTISTSSIGGSPQVDICVRDYECEDGDAVAVFVNGFMTFETEIFNAPNCKRAVLQSGNNTLKLIALNGTGFKGACNFGDVNTGELTIYPLTASGARRSGLSQT